MLQKNIISHIVKGIGICMLLVMPTMLHGQDSRESLKEETLKTLDKARDALQKDDYKTTLQLLDEASEKVSALLGDLIAAALPEKAGNWMLVKQSTGYEGFPQTTSKFSTTRTYEPVKKGEENDSTLLNDWLKPRITVTITDEFTLGTEVSKAHTMGESYLKAYAGEYDVYQPIRINNYRALLKSSSSMKTSSLTMIVGAAVVHFNGYNVDDYNDLKLLAQAVDFQKIKALFGE